MKKIIAALSISIVICSAKSQSYFHPEVCWGVNGGLNFSTISFVPTIKQSQLQGFVGGATFRYITEKHFGLQVEANFSQRGWSESFDDPALFYSRTLNYLEMPFLTHLYFGNQRLRFIVNLGPQIAILLNDSEKGVFTPTKKPEHNKLVQNRFDYGICAGGGFELVTGVGHFILEGRYNYGLSDIFSNAKGGDFARSSNQVTSVHLTYLFQIK